MHVSSSVRVNDVALRRTILCMYQACPIYSSGVIEYIRPMWVNEPEPVSGIKCQQDCTTHGINLAKSLVPSQYQVSPCHYATSAVVSLSNARVAHYA